MKRIAIAAFAALIGFGLMIQDADARRFGGARSSGISRDSSIMRRDAASASSPARPAAPSQAAPPAGVTPPAPASGMSRWLGPIAGLAAGIGIASLFSHFGMGGGMGNLFMLIALAIGAVYLVRWLMSKRPSNAMQYAGAGNSASLPLEPATMPAYPSAGVSTTIPASNVPADFDVSGFLRQAKLNFVRLQAANDRGDMDDIRQFTSPEMFAEVQLDYQDRGRKTQQTDVIELNADLLDVTNEATRQIASVRFHGTLREETTAAPEAFNEVWHLSKSIDGVHNWMVVGIQQV